MLRTDTSEVKSMQTVNQKEDELKLKRDKETLESLEDYKAGRLIDGDVMMEWIESWGTEDEKEPPFK